MQHIVYQATHPATDVSYIGTRTQDVSAEAAFMQQANRADDDRGVQRIVAEVGGLAGFEFATIAETDDADEAKFLRNNKRRELGDRSITGPTNYPPYMNKQWATKEKEHAAAVKKRFAAMQLATAIDAYHNNAFDDATIQRAVDAHGGYKAAGGLSKVWPSTLRTEAATMTPQAFLEKYR